MTTELYWLTLTLLMTALFWLPYVLDRIATRGLLGATLGTTPETGEKQSPWAQRAMKAHANAIENLAIFAPAVLALHLLNVSTPTTRLAAAAYFFARLAHFLVYTLGIPFARTPAFAVAWAAQIALIAALLKWV